MRVVQSKLNRDPKAVFVIHGRHEKAREAMFAFLSALGLHPLEWPYLVRLTGKGSPYVGEVLDAAFEHSTAAVVLFTPDDEAQLRPQFRTVNDPIYETTLTGQARPNVIFEAGMALGIAPDRTILVELGTLRPISDLSGRHVIRINNKESKRHELAERLKTAGCIVDLSQIAWKTAGDFDTAIQDLQKITVNKESVPTDLDPGYVIEISVKHDRIGKCSFEIIYPQIQELADTYVQRRINSILEQEFLMFGGVVGIPGQTRNLASGMNDDPPTKTSISFEIGLASTAFLSLRVDKTVELAGPFRGAHPFNLSTGYVIDMSSGYRYGLNDLFQQNQNYLGLLKAHIQRLIHLDFVNGPDWSNSLPELGEEVPRQYDYYFTERELVIVNLFESHALQSVWGRIPFSELTIMADQRGPLYKLLASRSAAEVTISKM